jgi:hypothetical protein
MVGARLLALNLRPPGGAIARGAIARGAIVKHRG